MERAPPGLSKRARVAMKWMKRTTRSRYRILAGQEIPTNYGRNNNSPATGVVNLLLLHRIAKPLHLREELVHAYSLERHLRPVLSSLCRRTSLRSSSLLNPGRLETRLPGRVTNQAPSSGFADGISHVARILLRAGACAMTNVVVSTPRSRVKAGAPGTRPFRRSWGYTFAAP